jgi:SAM-dependent methyltransferase
LTMPALGEYGVASRERLKIITRGRATGLPHVVSVRFVFDGGVFYVLAGRPGIDWVRNARSSGSAKVRLGEAVFEARASLASAAERSGTLERFTQKYGRATTEGWYAKAETCLRLEPLGPPTSRGGVKGESEAGSTFAAWKGTGSGYYEGVAEAFDSASEEYDHTIRNNFINVWIRNRSIQELLSLSRPEDVALEVGCGTGAEAMVVSRHVAGVVATDISPAMISLVRKKAALKSARGRVSAVTLGAAEISGTARLLPGGRTRLAYSFNGALNCEPSIDRFPSELAKVMEDGGYFVCSVRNTLCLSEAIAHGVFLQFGRMAPRKKQPIMVSVGGLDIPSTYYSPRRFASFFRPQFRVVKTIGLPAILPPAYLSDFYFRARRVLSFAERAETALAGSFPLNRFGDQTLFVFQKDSDVI